MRNALKWVAAFVLLSLFSCSKSESEFGYEYGLNEPGVYGYLTPIIEEDAPDTKAVVYPDENWKYVWEVGDRVNIWSETGTLLIYKVVEVSENGRTAVFNGGGFTLSEGETYYSSHPFIRKTTDELNTLSLSYEGQVQTADNDGGHLADYTFTYASATCTDGSTPFVYNHFSSYFRIIVKLPDALTLTELKISGSSDDFFALNGMADVQTGTFTPGDKSSTMTLKLDNVEVSDKVLNAFLSVPPCDAGDYIIRVKDSDGKVYTSPVITKTAVAPGTAKRFEVEVFEGEEPGVAKIGNVVYPSLAAAVADAQADDVITMIANDNISLTTAGSEVTIDKPLTITGAVDATGKPMYTIYGSPDGALNNSSFNDLFIACGTGTVTVSNVAFEGFGDQISSVIGHAPVFVSGSNDEVIIDNVHIRSLNCEGIHINGGTFTVSNCNIDCTKTVESVFTKGICVVNDATGSIIGTTITGVDCDNDTDTSAAIELQGSGDITITGCLIQSETIGIATTPVQDLTPGTSQVTISGCDVISQNIAVYSNGDNGALTSITSGSYYGLLIAGDNDEGFAISGGVFSDDVIQEFCAEDYIPADNIDPETMEDYPYTVAKAEVAMIGDVVYPSLAAAVAAVPTDGTQTTITMIGDHNVIGNAGVTIAANKNVILDLNGKTVCLVVTESKGSQLITNQGVLTITDSSTDQNGKLTNQASDDLAVGTWPTNNYVTNIITNSGTLNIEAGTIQSTANGSICYAVDNNSTSYDATLNVNGGYLTSVGTVVRQFCNSTVKQNTVNISGGTIETNGYAAVWTQLPGSSASSKKLATLNITGGVVSANSYAWYDYSYGDSFEAVDYSISGGELYGYLFSYAVYNGVKPGFITGGLFSEDPNEYGLVAPGYTSIASAEHEGMYEIGTADIYYYWYDGDEKDGGYYSFYAPFEGPTVILMDGEFIELLRDVVLTKDVTFAETCSWGDPISVGGTFGLTFGEYDIDLNGYKFPLPTGVSVKTDKQTTIFSAAENGYSVVETEISDGDFHYEYSVAGIVAKINDVGYTTLEAAWAAVQDGQTITLTADCAGNGLIAPQGKFTQGLTVDFNGHTYEVNGTLVGSSGTETQAFQLLKDSNITFKNGTIYSEKALFLVQNYSNLTLKDMTLTLNNANYANGYTLSNNNGTVVIDGTTINANPAGKFAFDVCRNSSYPSVDVTVKGSSVINGDIEFDASSGNPMNGVSLTLEAGTFNGSLSLTNGGKTALINSPDKASITKDDDVTLAAPADFKWVSNGDGTSTLTACDYVASVGDVKYETLVEAVAATTSGTITLLKDAAGAGVFVADGDNKDITIDFNGHTYEVTGNAVGSTGTVTQALHLEKGNTIVLKNGTVTSTSTSGVKMLVQNYCNLTVENMVLDGTNLPGTAPYTLSNNNGNVIIDGSTIVAKTGANAFDVCRYSSYPSVNVTVKGASVINGNIEFDAGSGDPKDGVSLTLEDCTVSGSLKLTNGGKTALIDSPNKASITKDEDIILAAPTDFDWVSNGDGTETLKAYVAIVNSVYYTSLVEAVNAVPAGTPTTITMVSNAQVEVSGYAITIAEGKNVVLDLNGKTVTGVCLIEGTSALIRNLGTLTINDSASGGKLIGGADPTWTWDGSDDYTGSYASNVIRNEGTMIVNGGTLYNASTGSAAYAIDNYGAGKVTINGGTLDAKKASAIRMFYNNGGSITVNGGTIGHYNNDDDCSYMGIQVMSGTNAVVNVFNGTIAGNYALYSNGTGSSAVNIYDGTFDGYVGFGSAGPDNISISGGKFTCWVGTWGSQTGFISGGLFAEELDSSCIAEGYIVTANTDPNTMGSYPYMVVADTGTPNPAPALTNAPKRASARKAVPATQPADYR